MGERWERALAGDRRRGKQNLVVLFGCAVFHLSFFFFKYFLLIVRFSSALNPAASPPSQLFVLFCSFFRVRSFVRSYYSSISLYFTCYMLKKKKKGGIFIPFLIQYIQHIVLILQQLFRRTALEPTLFFILFLQQHIIICFILFVRFFSSRSVIFYFFSLHP